MNRIRKNFMPIAIILSLVVLAGCNLFSTGEPVPSDPPGDDSEETPEFVFYYDFADLELGDLTSTDDLVVNNPNGVRGDVKIVADTGTDSGKALYLKTVTWTEEKKPSMSVGFPVWDIDSDQVETVGIEYKLKYGSGSEGMYFYVNETGSDHRIILRPLSDGRIVWTSTLDGNTSTTVKAIEPGWNTIRVIANKSTRSGDLYINDMENPVATSLPFQRVVPTWENIRIYITHETHGEQIREAYYGDLKVWVID